MRFIGSKSLLLDNIRGIIVNNTANDAESFCDIFSGTGTVARHFKPDYKIISNDALSFSHALQYATIKNNSVPLFGGLKKSGIEDVVSYLNNADVTISDIPNDAFIYNNYSPDGKAGRMYFTPKNALKIDYIRQTISKWLDSDLITKIEYYYLLALLIEAVPFISNTTGTYGAYLKHWDKRAHKDLTLEYLPVFDNKKSNTSHNQNTNDLIKEISGDILYIDPPYNARQYLPNYHVLETIARYDSPEIYGITGMRPYGDEKSDYSSKVRVLDAFEDLISNARFKTIVMSYRSHGLMSKDQIETILKKYGIEDTYVFEPIQYRKYKSKIVKETDVIEYLFLIQKDL
jgi:adenine-specific DNA-methyltransferase